MFWLELPKDIWIMYSLKCDLKERKGKEENANIKKKDFKVKLSVLIGIA